MGADESYMCCFFATAPKIPLETNSAGPIEKSALENKYAKSKETLEEFEDLLKEMLSISVRVTDPDDSTSYELNSSEDSEHHRYHNHHHHHHSDAANSPSQHHVSKHQHSEPQSQLLIPLRRQELCIKHGKIQWEIRPVVLFDRRVSATSFHCSSLQLNLILIMCNISKSCDIIPQKGISFTLTLTYAESMQNMSIQSILPEPHMHLESMMKLITSMLLLPQETSPIWNGGSTTLTTQRLIPRKLNHSATSTTEVARSTGLHVPCNKYIRCVNHLHYAH